MLGLGNTITSGSHHEQQYSLLFDGVSDLLDLGDSFQSTLRGDFTWSFWMKPYDGAPSYLDHIVGVETSDEKNVFKIQLLPAGDSDAGKLEIIHNTSDGSTDDTASYKTDAAFFADGGGNNWTHVAVRVNYNSSGDGTTTYMIYKNGEEVDATRTNSISAANHVNYTSTHNIYMGANNEHDSTPNGFFYGRIDEVALFSTAPGSARMDAIYNLGYPYDLNYDRGDYNFSSNLVAYWRMGNGLFDDKVNGIVHDAHNPGFGADLVVNGSFSADSNWTKQDGWTISGGTANFNFNNDNGSNRNIYPASSILTAGNIYKLEFDITSVTAGGIRMVNSSVSDDTTFSTVGTHILYWEATGVHLYMKADADAILSIDNVKVYKLNGYPAIVTDAVFSINTPDDE